MSSPRRISVISTHKIEQIKKDILHIVYYSKSRKCKVYDRNGRMTYYLPMRDTALGYGFGHNGKCPRGRYIIGKPKVKNTPSFGPYFIPIYPIGKNYGRSGIGIHGGGRALPNPLTPYQGWSPTHGCLRVQNKDLGKLVGIIHTYRERKIRGYIDIR